MGLVLRLFDEHGQPVPGGTGLTCSERCRLWVWNHLLPTRLRLRLLATRHGHLRTRIS